MAEKIINSRIQLKTDTSSNWNNAPDFIPKKGEFIFYSDLQKFKMGDGSNMVGALDFVNEEQIFKCIQDVTTFAEVTQALNEGKLPILWNGNGDLRTMGMFTRIRSDVYAFMSPLVNTVLDQPNGWSWKANYLYATGYDSTKGWVSTSTYDGLDTRHISTSITSSSTDKQVPSAKATYTNIQAVQASADAARATATQALSKADSAYNLANTANTASEQNSTRIQTIEDTAPQFSLEGTTLTITLPA